MVFDSSLVTYLVVVSVLTVTPGADTMLVMKNVFGYGERAGLITTIGICSGLFFHAALSAFGLSLILVKSAQAFEVVKLCGAVYLIFLGARTLFDLFFNKKQFNLSAEDNYSLIEKQRGSLEVFSQGLLNNVLNPKVAVFYLAFLPQFVHIGENVLAKTMFLACIHVIMGLIWLGMISLIFGRIGNWLKDSHIREVLEGFSGAVLILLGVKLAFEKH
jgi:threonine/homoserine/homoserine lactone efflux protein